MMRIVMAAAAAALVAGPAESPEVWVFFSPDSPDASRIFGELRGLPVRPVLLVERYFGAGEPPAAFLETVRAAGTEIPVVDAEGLLAAERFRIAELPALAVKAGGRLHVAAGSGLDVKEVLRCAVR